MALKWLRRGAAGEEDATARMAGVAGQRWRERGEDAAAKEGRKRAVAVVGGWQRRQAMGRRGRRGDGGGCLHGCTEEEQRVMAACVVAGCSLRSRSEKEEGGSRIQRGLPQGRWAAGGTVDTTGQQLVVAAGQWLRAGEGGGSGVGVRSAQQWLRLRAREAAAEAALEEKGRWWPVAGAGEEEGVAAMAAQQAVGRRRVMTGAAAKKAAADEGGEEEGATVTGEGVTEEEVTTTTRAAVGEVGCDREGR
ncbi:hypothetical protein B296_00028254 [Ensete ventricosum]|uniref:DUF834 domain-containing protein n=1 Tax=Ensete ventricosum TaxID=4639 RepID=A0A426ZJF1_ENSVE|nr:hypothetical protein B296_00028254 [Ensete ventricosum]